MAKKSIVRPIEMNGKIYITFRIIGNGNVEAGAGGNDARSESTLEIRTRRGKRALRDLERSVLASG
jgi:hypothetical protein